MGILDKLKDAVVEQAEEVVEEVEVKAKKAAKKVKDEAEELVARVSGAKSSGVK